MCNQTGLKVDVIFQAWEEFLVILRPKVAHSLNELRPFPKNALQRSCIQLRERMTRKTDLQKGFAVALNK